MEIKSIDDIKNLKVLYIATKNSDYLRITQEIKILCSNNNELQVIASHSKSYLKRLLFVYKKLITVKVKDFDLVFIGFAPQLVIPIFGRKLGKRPIVEDFFISVYDTLCFDRKKFKPNTLLGKLMLLIDKKTIKMAQLVICDTNTHGRYFCSEFSYPQQNMSTLYLQADSSIYYPRPQEKHSDFTVLYFGSVLPLQGVQVILDAIEILENEKNIKFIFIGPIGKNNVKKGLKITEFIEWLPQEKLAEKIASADLCLAGHFEKSIMKAHRTIPGKAYIYSAMKKPMILGDNEATRELYDESENGIYFTDMGNSQKLAHLIMKIKDEIYEKNN